MANIKIYDEEDDINEDEIFDSDNIIDNQDDLINLKDDEIEKETINTFSETDYKVTSITNSFLRIECSIKVESSKTPIKFKYRGEQYRGIVMQKMPNSSDDYIFLVQKVGKLHKGEKNNKFMKKIHIPDASLI